MTAFSLGSTEGFPREVEPVVNDLNRLLDRQEQLVRRARDRAGALAHGLKTPLTILAGEARRLERRGEKRGGGEDQQPAPTDRRPRRPRAGAGEDRRRLGRRRHLRACRGDGRSPVPPDAAHAARRGARLAERAADGHGHPDRSGRLRRGGGQPPRQCAEMGELAGRGPRREGWRRRATIAVLDDGPGLCRRSRPIPNRTAGYRARPGPARRGSASASCTTSFPSTAWRCRSGRRTACAPSPSPCRPARSWTNGAAPAVAAADEPKPPARALPKIA